MYICTYTLSEITLGKSRLGNHAWEISPWKSPLEISLGNLPWKSLSELSLLDI